MPIGKIRSDKELSKAVESLHNAYNKLASTLPKIVTTNTPSKYYHELQTLKGGPMRGWGLVNKLEVAVAYYKCPGGTVVAEHVHPNSVEYYIVTVGKIKCDFRDNGIYYTKCAKEGGSMMVPANTPHQFTAEEDCEIVVITIPADEGMPAAPFGEREYCI